MHDVVFTQRAIITGRGISEVERYFFAICQTTLLDAVFFCPVIPTSNVARPGRNEEEKSARVVPTLIFLKNLHTAFYREKIEKNSVSKLTKDEREILCFH